MHIGLFDSGVGGLTVLKELKRQIPHARYSYLADTAHLPYGDKSFAKIKEYSKRNIKFLEELKVDLILIACHSASILSMKFQYTESGTPVYNMIEPSGKEVLARTKNGRIGILATKATVKKRIYRSFIKQLNPKAQVFSKSSPLLAPLVEEGFIEGPVIDQILQYYLEILISEKIDTLLLGCTHYPILQPAISKIMGPDVCLVNPADSVTNFIKKRHKVQSEKESFTVYLTDHRPNFTEQCRRMLPDLAPDEIIQLINKKQDWIK